MNGLPATLAVISAMITPAVLISAAGLLTISTSSRLARVIDRTRKLSEDFEKCMAGRQQGPVREEERLIFDQLGTQVRRSRMLQQALTLVYLSLGVFIGTSVAIGIVSVAGQRHAWLPLVLGLAGAGLLFYASLLLIAESRLAFKILKVEMDFILRHGRERVPAELLERIKRGGGSLR